MVLPDTGTDTDTDTSLRFRDCRNQIRFNDSGIFDGHIAGALDFCRFAGVRIGVHGETGIAQPRHADRNFVLVGKDVSISIRQRFVRSNDRNVGGDRMFFGTPPSESNRLQKSVWGNLVRGCHIPAPLRFMAAHQQEAQTNQQKASEGNDNLNLRGAC